MGVIDLITKNPNDTVALRSLRVHSVIAGMSQTTVVEQLFVNREQHAVETVYTFPLPDGAAVCAFEVITGDHVLTGVIEETDAAIASYLSAIAAGDAAYLAEQERPDVFTIRVGNIKSRQSAVVRLTYVCPLEIVHGSIRLTFPTTLAPRFVTGTGMNPLDAVIDADALNPPHAPAVPYGLTFSAEIRLSRLVKSISSPTHPIQLGGNDTDGYQLSLVGPIAMDREVVVGIELAREPGPIIQFETGRAGESYLAMSFLPELQQKPQNAEPSEIIFLLDCSGSMCGSSIQHAIAALELCLRSLNAGDTFNICKFGSTFQLMSAEAVIYSQTTLDNAIAYIASGNDLGGTRLFEPLQAVMQAPPKNGLVRSIIVLTDGQVTNEPALIAMARLHRAHNRIFSVGIGGACSSFLIRGLARVTGGAAEFICLGENIHQKVLRTFARVGSPVVSEIEIDWHGADVQTLAEFPPLFDGEALIVFARVAGRRPEQVSLQCMTESGLQSWSVAVPATPLEGTGIARMWARRSIQSLEEVNGIARTTVARAKSKDRELLIQLSKEFGLLSSRTTFVALEHRSIKARTQGRPPLRRVPVTMPAGWGGGSGYHQSVANLCYSETSHRLVSRQFVASERPSQGIFAKLFKGRAARRMAKLESALAAQPFLRCATATGGSASYSSSLGTPNTRQPISDDLIQLSNLLKLQSAGGDFQWNAQALQIASTLCNWPELSAEAEGWVPEHQSHRQDVIATAKVLLLLRTKFINQEPLWNRAAQKAIRYLAATTGCPRSEIVDRFNLRS